MRLLNKIGAAIVVALFFLLPAALGQGSVVTFPEIVPSSTPMGYLIPAAAASIRVCYGSVAIMPCTPVATIYTDSTLSTVTDNPLVSCSGVHPSGCIDTNANVSFGCVPGLYTIQTTYLGLTLTQTVPCAVVPSSNNIFTGTNTFTQIITGNITGNAGTATNAFALQGATWDAPLPIGVTTPNVGVFTSINNTQMANVFPGADACAKIHAAWVALPSTGGIVDATGFQGIQSCSSNPFAGLSKSGVLLLGNATFQTTASWILPNKVSMYGIGRGDAGTNNTTIQAVTGFPSSTAVVAQGNSSPSFGIKVENLAIDCNSQTGAIGLQNFNAEEESFGRHLLISNCPNIGLDLETAGAQNSGPYEDLEINNPSSTSAAALAIVVNQVAAFRGIHGATINFNGSTSPTVAMQVDSIGTYNDIHCEYIGDCIRIGSIAPTSGVLVNNMECGPSTTTCVHIASTAGNQDITAMGITVSVGNNVVDDVLSSTLTDSSVAFYMLGDGSGTSKTRITSSNTALSQFSSQIKSLLTTGTAPFVVASTTVVANLNVSQLLGFTWAVPGTIGSTTPSTGAFTTLSATGQVTSTLATGTAPFVITSTTPVANLSATPTTYNHSGTQITNAHIVADTCTLGTSCSVTLVGSAVFTNSSSYQCSATDITAAAAVKFAPSSGSAFALTGTGTDVLSYHCVGN